MEEFAFQNLLASQLEMEKMRVEQEKKKVLLAQEAVKEKVVCVCVTKQTIQSHS